ncbi:MAG: FAD-binding oxidoreductase [Candidatus Heimdallarchaeota archaeon]
MTTTVTKPIKKKPRYMVDTVGIVTKMIRETRDTQTLRIATPSLPEDQAPFRFNPGQFVMVRPYIEQHDKIIPRAYSISSSPTRAMKEGGYFDLTVRQTEEPTVSKWLNDRKVGDEIPFRGPYGNFVWEPGNPESEQLFLFGGGSGVTPLKCILEYIHDKELKNKVTLFYSCRTQKDIIFEEELPKLVQGSKDARLVITLTREDENSPWTGSRGRFGLEDIKNELNRANFDIDKSTFYLCGTPAFVAGMIKHICDIGVNKARIKKERWD